MQQQNMPTTQMFGGFKPEAMQRIAGNLGYQMERINAGDFVQISYEGKKKIESGKMEGRMAHNFKVLVDKPE